MTRVICLRLSILCLLLTAAWPLAEAGHPILCPPQWLPVLLGFTSGHADSPKSPIDGDIGGALFTDPLSQSVDKALKAAGGVMSEVMCSLLGQCDPALVLPDASCTGEPPPPDDPECVHWTLIDMAALPYTMGSGTTLNAYTGLGPILGDVPTSNGCSTVPADSSRGFAGVNTDGVVDFDAPVSELYVATFHVQTGDDLVTLPTSTTTDVGCNLSAVAGGTIQHVSLDTPSAQVSVQDIDPDGGTGYSFMIAECTEWAGK